MSTINDPRIQVLKETYHAMGPAQTREVYDLKGKRYYSEQEVIDELNFLDNIQNTLADMNTRFIRLGDIKLCYFKNIEEVRAVFHKYSINETYNGIPIKRA